MHKALSICLAAMVSACATVPDSVKVALEKESAAINAVEADHRISVNMYHAELVNSINNRLDDIFKYEVEKIQNTGNKLTAGDVARLESQRKEQRTKLLSEAEKAKAKYLNSRNLEILKALHAKVLQYSASDRFTTSDFSTLLTQIDADLDKINQPK